MDRPQYRDAAVIFSAGEGIVKSSRSSARREGKAVQVELPSSVQLKITEAAEGLRGDTASNVTKPAVLETGKTVNVPLFIQEGETVKIDTRTGAYMGRA
jgi:elongation factor P